MLNNLNVKADADKVDIKRGVFNSLANIGSKDTAESFSF